MNWWCRRLIHVMIWTMMTFGQLYRMLQGPRMFFLYQRYESNIYVRQSACYLEMEKWLCLDACLSNLYCTRRRFFSSCKQFKQFKHSKFLVVRYITIVLGETFGNQASTNWSTTHVLNILLWSLSIFWLIHFVSNIRFSQQCKLFFFNFVPRCPLSYLSAGRLHVY